MRELFTKFTKLETLKLRLEGWQDLISPSLVCGLGASLRKLTLQEIGGPDLPIPSEDLERVRASCPNIHSLGLDLPENLDNVSYRPHSLYF